jgi:hypothetical protein
VHTSVRVLPDICFTNKEPLSTHYTLVCHDTALVKHTHPHTSFWREGIIHSNRALGGGTWQHSNPSTAVRLPKICPHIPSIPSFTSLNKQRMCKSRTVLVNSGCCKAIISTNISASKPRHIDPKAENSQQSNTPELIRKPLPRLLNFLIRLRTTSTTCLGLGGFLPSHQIPCRRLSRAARVPAPQR